MYSFHLTNSFTKAMKIIVFFSVYCFLASICVSMFACVINYLPPGVIGSSGVCDYCMHCHVYLFSASVKNKLLQRIRI